MIRLFEAGTTTFNTHGLGDLNDAVSCKVTKTDLMYEMVMEYPVTGRRFADLQKRRIVYTRPDQVDSEQPFVIYRVTKATRGKVTVYARHVSYELSGIVTNRFTATSAADFAAKVTLNAMTPCPFIFTTDISTEDTLEISAPASIRSLLGGNVDTWQGAYGGELRFNGWAVSLLQNAGEDRGVVIRYGVDLIDASMEESIDEMYTGVVPYYKDDSAYIIGAYQPAGNFSYINAEPVDVTQYFPSVPTQASVEAMGRAWIADNKVGVPKVSLRVTYAQLKQTVALYDVVTVKIVPLDIDVQAKISRTVWDAVKERYESVDIGQVRSSLSDDMWDAGRLRKGLLPVERIRDRSIGGGKLGGGAVSMEKLAKDAKDTIEDAQDTANAANSLAGTAWAYADANKDRFLADLNYICSALTSNTTYSGFRNSVKDKPM